MDLMTIEFKIRGLATHISLAQAEDVKSGKIANVLSDLCIKITEEYHSYLKPLLSPEIIIALFIYESWKSKPNIDITGVTPEQIANALTTPAKLSDTV